MKKETVETWQSNMAAFAVKDLLPVENKNTLYLFSNDYTLMKIYL